MTSNATPSRPGHSAEAWVSARVRSLFHLDEQTLHMDASLAAGSLREIADRDVSCSAFAEVRQSLARSFGCDADELAVTQSATDSLCRIIAGLDLRAGDEILTSNHEHYGALAPLAVARDRHGVVLRTVALPVGSRRTTEEFVDLFASAITGRTRVLLFSSPTYTTGTLLPTRMLARLAQLHGVVSIADAAHVPGMLDTSFHDLGVDFIAGSGTKWQCGPAGTGLLYVRNKVLNEHNPQPLPVFWPVVSVWYPLEGGLPPRTTTRVPSYDIAEYLQASGSASQARMMGLQRACEIWDRIGRGRIERHLLDLSAHLKELIVDRWGESSVYSPRTDARLCSAITTFTPFRPSDRHDASRCATFVSRLRDEYGVVIRDVTFAVAGSPAPHCALRIAARLFHERSDNDRLVRAMAALSDDMA